MPLTKKQKAVMDYIRDHCQTHGYAPTLREIGSHFGLSSVATVHKHVKTLVEKGSLHYEEGRARSATVVTPGAEAQPEVPLLGLIAAGTPIEALEQPETMAVPKDLLGRGGNYVLKVKGESMIEDHICDGDFIIVEKRDHAENGEIVVALVGSEATVKRYYRESGRIRLQPANSSMQPIYADGDAVKVQGVVIGILRKMKR